MSEQWAFCDRCSRWFYGDREAYDADRLRCPVCDSSPSMLRDQPADPTVTTA